MRARPWILASTLAVAAALPAAAQATWPGKARHVIYCDGELHRIRPDGTHDRLLATSGRGLCAVAVSRRGNEVAFAGHEGLTLIRADGTHKRVIVSSSSFTPWIRTIAWSPDARRLAFTAVQEEDVNGNDEIEEVPSIYTVRRDGRRLHRLKHDASSPIWSAHGHHLFWVGDRGIIRSRPNGKNRHVVVPHDGGDIDLSPRGHRLLYEGSGYSRERGGLSYIRTFDLRTGRRTSYDASYDTDLSATAFAWAPGGRRISFVDLNGPLQTVRPDGTGRRTLFGFPGSQWYEIRFFAWQTGGRR